jgi:hypothetical protein
VVARACNTTLGRLRHEDLEFKGNLATCPDPVSKTKAKLKQNIHT